MVVDLSDDTVVDVVIGSVCGDGCVEDMHFALSI